MFGIGMPELILILVVGLIVIGPTKLPELAKSLGRAINEFKKATREFKDSLDIDEDIRSIKQPFKDINRDLRSPLPPLPMPDTKPSTVSAEVGEAPPALADAAPRSAEGAPPPRQSENQGGSKTDA